MGKIILPLGIDSFEKIRNNDFYYIDKTELIAELVEKPFEVHLFTRPRRFGKTLAMDMLANYFDIRKNTAGLFQGLNISKNKSLCEKWQNQWPVIFLSLKEIDDRTIEGAVAKMATCFADLYKQNLYLLKSEAGIFTGTNHYVADTIGGKRFNEFFGFTAKEIKQLLKDADFLGKEEEIEAKRAESVGRLVTDCEKAVKQIDKKQYADEFKKGYQAIICYGIAFCGKSCMVKRLE